MSTKKQFIDELDEYSRTLKATLDQVRQEVASVNEATAKLVARRKQRIAEHAARLLPDLKPDTILVLNRKVPGVVGVQGVQLLLEEERQARKDRVDQFIGSTWYSPDGFEGKKLELEVELGKLEADLVATRRPLDDLLANGDVRHLIENGYGTAGYRWNWWNSQYYRDWKAADAVVARLQLNSWEDLASRHESWSILVADLERQMKEGRDSLKTLLDHRAQYEALQGEVLNADLAVLDKLRVKVTAFLDHVDPVPAWMEDVASLNKRIETGQEELLKIHEDRSKLTDQLDGLHKLRTKAQASKRSEVPEEFVQAVRTSRRRPVVSTVSPGTSTVHVHHDDSLLNTVLYMNMIDHFGHRDSRQHDGDGGRAYEDRSADFAAARADRSGRS